MARSVSLIDAGSWTWICIEAINSHLYIQCRLATIEHSERHEIGNGIPDLNFPLAWLCLPIHNRNPWITSEPGTITTMVPGIENGQTSVGYRYIDAQVSRNEGFIRFLPEYLGLSIGVDRRKQAIICG